MSTERGSRPASATSALQKGGWHVALARLLGRSSRWATDESNRLFQEMGELISGPMHRPVSVKSELRAGLSVRTLVQELVELVDGSDRAALARQERFWYLVRELHSRRPWVRRRPRDLVDTVGIELEELERKTK